MNDWHSVSTLIRLILFTICHLLQPDSVENGGTATRTTSGSQSDKAWLARIWGGFDTKYMKPLLTHSKPTLVETLPSCCLPLAKMLTSSEQLNQVYRSFFASIYLKNQYYNSTDS